MTDALKLALDAALKLAEQGIPSFPCRENKAPATLRGFYSATTDANALRCLWREYPGPLVGVPTGSVSGFDVLDLDFGRHQEAVDWWCANKSGIPITCIHRTRSGGIHCLFQHDDGARSVNGWLETGVDVKASGGYIIHWPSHHTDRLRCADVSLAALAHQGHAASSCPCFPPDPRERKYRASRQVCFVPARRPAQLRSSLGRVPCMGRERQR
jgi:hypothetical protein